MTTTAPDSTFLRFTKHHGAGNDFLVLVDPDGARPAAPATWSGPCATATSGWAPTG